MAITDAVCIPAKCGKTSRDFYMMYYKAFDEKWVLTYGKKELPRSWRFRKCRCCKNEFS